MSNRRMPRCFYCAQAYVGEQSPEHILPAAINVELTTTRVCNDCNLRVGRAVDAPWLADPHIELLRKQFRVPDRRGRLPRPVTRTRGRLADGDDALIEIEGEEIRIRRVPRQTADGQRLMLSGYTADEYERLVERMHRRCPGFAIVREEIIIEEQLTASTSRRYSVDTWPRFAAKVALGVASLVVEDDDWLDSTGAQLLRDVLWSGHPESRQNALSHRGVAWSALPLLLQAGSHPLRPGQHLLTFEATEQDGQWLIIALFGSVVYRVPVPLDWGSMPPQSWLFTSADVRGRQLPSAVQHYLMMSDQQQAPST